MKAKIVITTASVEDAEYRGRRRSEIWSGDMDILDDREYLLRFCIIVEGQPQPIVDVPFAIGIGQWVWIPPDPGKEDEEGWSIHNHDEVMGDGYNGQGAERQGQTARGTEGKN